LSDFDTHFDRVRELKNFERRLIKLVLDQPDALSRPHETLYRYAINLAKSRVISSPNGRDIDVADEVDPLRRWMCDTLVPLLPDDEPPELEPLRDLAPVLALRVDRTRRELLDHHVDDFSARHLDKQLRQKELVLVLGGGGGSGLFHLGAFSLFDELGITPEFIVGSSMGSVMAVLRALSREYDPFPAAFALPRDLDYGHLFRPYTGYSRYGFPGAFHLNLLRTGRAIFEEMFDDPDIRFSDLPIDVEIVTCGILRGYQIDTEEYEQAAADTEEATPMALRDRLKLFFSALRQLSSNPQFLREIVFGRAPLTRDFPVIEALGFSCAVPGLLHFDVFHDDPATIDPLEKLFERHDLLRLCDGGVVNNVASNVAWESIQAGKIGSRNTFIASFDVFAPVARRRNVIWLPIQQMVRQTVLDHRPYSDFHKTFESPPSPLNVLVNNYSELKDIVQQSRAELESDIPFLRRALEQLPPYGIWDIGSEDE
jgi:predicted acylesterase/phospholipase RssA